MTIQELAERAFLAGFQCCRGYGDNHIHFRGEQRERVMAQHLGDLLAAFAPAPVAPPAKCGYEWPGQGHQGYPNVCSLEAGHVGKHTDSGTLQMTHQSAVAPPAQEPERTPVYCGEQHKGFACTRAPGHDGDHVASNKLEGGSKFFAPIYERWPTPSPSWNAEDTRSFYERRLREEWEAVGGTTNGRWFYHSLLPGFSGDSRSGWRYLIAAVRQEQAASQPFKAGFQMARDGSYHGGPNEDQWESAYSDVGEAYAAYLTRQAGQETKGQA